MKVQVSGSAADRFADEDTVRVLKNAWGKVLMDVQADEQGVVWITFSDHSVLELRGTGRLWARYRGSS